MYILVPVYKRLLHTITFIDSCEDYISSDHLIILIDDRSDKEHFAYFKDKPSINVINGSRNQWWGEVLIKK